MGVRAWTQAYFQGHFGPILGDQNLDQGSFGPILGVMAYFEGSKHRSWTILDFRAWILTYFHGHLGLFLREQQSLDLGSFGPISELEIVANWAYFEGPGLDLGPRMGHGFGGYLPISKTQLLG